MYLTCQTALLTPTDLTPVNLWDRSVKTYGDELSGPGKPGITYEDSCGWLRREYNNNNPVTMGVDLITFKHCRCVTHQWHDEFISMAISGFLLWC